MRPTFRIISLGGLLVVAGLLAGQPSPTAHAAVTAVAPATTKTVLLAGPPSVAAQNTVAAVALPPTKTVLLAWVGQRVILEHDWRVPPGDTMAGDILAPVGTCTFSSNSTVTYVSTAGPGNFLPELGATLVSPSEVSVTVAANAVQSPGQFPTSPQGSCISRVLYQSEDQGEVDVEASLDPAISLQKAAFVIFYMKFERVDLSFPQASKPTFNATGKDFTPGNPWDEGLDSAQPTWDVTRDLLVRGRVRGWFFTSVPSGRSVDATDPLNVLPANRWVMPDDWNLLAGGRQQYDIMTAPNNSQGFACAAPAGTCTDATSNSLSFAYGPFSALDLPGPVSAAISPSQFSSAQTIFQDGAIDRWDAPMPPAMVDVRIRGTGLLKQVLKQDVYYTGQADQPGTQTFPNLFYQVAVPGSPFLVAAALGGGYLWDTWGNDGPGGVGAGAYPFWAAIPTLLSGPGTAPNGTSDTSLSLADVAAIQTARSTTADPTLSRDLALYSDNHGEFMAVVNGDFKTGPTAGAVAGLGTLSAVADYPDLRGKHFPVASAPAIVTWAWPPTLTGPIPASFPSAAALNTPICLDVTGYVPFVTQLDITGATVQNLIMQSAGPGVTRVCFVPFGFLGSGVPAPVPPGTYQITATNPGPPSRTSNTVLLFVTGATAPVTNVTVATATAAPVTVSAGVEGSTPVVSASSTGTGTVAVANYGSNPGGTPSFQAGASSYFDVYVSPASTFTSVSITYCDPAGGTVAYWWNGSAWQQASNQAFNPVTRCITITVNAAGTFPTIAQLAGLIFGAASHAPTITAITGPGSPLRLGTTATVQVNLGDQDQGDLHTVAFDWGDSTSSSIDAEVALTVLGTHTYAATGVYTVSVTVANADGVSISGAFQYVVVYDPTGGTVTGGGWITSPLGACKLTVICLGATGKAEFGFESKYKKGQSIPTGDTEFQFEAGKFHFKSTSYEWLVINGPRAQYKGKGKIEGSYAQYGFILTAIDGNQADGGGVDKFRIKIWEMTSTGTAGRVVYDNRMDADDEVLPTTALGGGSIVIHK